MASELADRPARDPLHMYQPLEHRLKSRQLQLARVREAWSRLLKKRHAKETWG